MVIAPENLFDRVLICGGRTFSDYEWLSSVLDQVGPKSIIQGAAPGADSLAGRWAYRRQIFQRIFPADWKKHGRSAGPIRNQQMLTEGQPTMVVAFPGGPGTAHMVRIARQAGLPVIAF